MPFEVIPAIDVSSGRLARLEAGAVVPVEAFDGDPVAAAEEFILQGARRLHVVDLDLAFTGRPENLQTISLLAVMDARIRPRGRIDLDLPFEETLDWLAGTEAARFLHVAVDRVGGLTGPDLEGPARLAFRTRRPVIASGGIATAEDVGAVASLGPHVQG